MKTGLRSGETLWEQWPQICHHEHYTQVDHAVFVHLEHHHQLYHHQIITFANIDIFERPPLRITCRPNLNFATKADNTSVNWDELKGRLSSFQVAAPELLVMMLELIIFLLLVILTLSLHISCRWTSSPTSSPSSLTTTRMGSLMWENFCGHKSIQNFEKYESLSIKTFFSPRILPVWTRGCERCTS